MTRLFRSIWFYIALLIILTIPLCQGLWSKDLVNGHDAVAGLIRALAMERYMGHGQFLARWAPEVNWGYGYPMFNFYPPFFSFIAVIINQLTHHMIMAVNGACILFWILSSVGMFLLGREYWGNEGGMLSGILYVYAPYHLIDLYTRGAFAEFAAFAFFPFFLLSILKISQKGGLRFFLLGVASAFGLSLTHNIMSMLFFPVAGAYMAYLYFFEKRGAWIITAMVMIVLGLMMSSFFWVPALLEKKFLNLHFLVGMRYDFHKNFISLSDLFWPFNNENRDGVSFHVGMIHSLICLVSLSCLYKLFKINRSLGRGYVFFLTVGALAIFFTLPYSHIFWENINILHFIQFPWRFLAIIVFALSFLGGSLGVIFKDPLPKRVLVIIAGALVIIFTLRSFPNQGIAANPLKIEEFVAMGEGEYTPQWVTVPPTKAFDSKFQVIKGSGVFGEVKQITPVQFETIFQSTEQSILCFHSFYFPGWQVFVDGQETKIFPNFFGMMIFIVPPGEHMLRVVFGATTVRIMAMIISWIGVILTLGAILWTRHSK